VAAPAWDPRHLAATSILDWHARSIAQLASAVRSDDASTTLRAAHRAIADRIRPVYALDETQPASRTLGRGRGSCSQRFAVLESVARASGIPTKVRGLSVEGRFWYPRFRLLRVFVPDRVVLAWPFFFVDDRWLSASEVFAPLGSSDVPFTNEGETLFDAIESAGIDWDGVTSSPGAPSMCDLSGVVGEDLGEFARRDELFRRHRTMSRALEAVADPILRHRMPRVR
jgi:hypothetical protein